MISRWGTGMLGILRCLEGIDESYPLHVVWSLSDMTQGEERQRKRETVSQSALIYLRPSSGSWLESLHRTYSSDKLKSRCPFFLWLSMHMARQGETARNRPLPALVDLTSCLTAGPCQHPQRFPVSNFQPSNTGSIPSNERTPSAVAARGTSGLSLPPLHTNPPPKKKNRDRQTL